MGKAAHQTDGPAGHLLALIERDDAAELDRWLGSHPRLAARLERVKLDFGRPLPAAARSVETAAVLLEHGAGVTAVGEWWAAGGHGVLSVDREVGRFLVERGAAVTAHAAAGLGLADRLAALLRTDPGAVDARGIDGTRPLHFARTLEVADLLLDHGAELEATDEDHDSTAVQWLIGDQPAVARHLVRRGARPDLFLAAALGDAALAERLVSERPESLGWWIGKSPFPGIGHRGRGGTIYQWTLAFNSFAHQIAASNGHGELAERLWRRSEPATRLLVACVTGRRAEARALAHEVERLDAFDLTLLARHCWETNADVEAVRLMLDVGFPVDLPETSHGHTPLHNAAWGGFAELVELLLERGHPPDVRDPDHGATPLGWALYCCLEDGRHPEGEYGRVVELLLDAGCPWDPAVYPTGHPGVDRALAARLPGP